MKLKPPLHMFTYGPAPPAVMIVMSHDKCHNSIFQLP